MTAWFGPNGTVVHYYVRRGEMVNWIAHYETDWREESWSVESDWREAAEAFAGWHPTLAELFSRTERCYKWALYDRDPLPRWTHGPRDAARRRRAPDAALSRAGRGAGGRGRLCARRHAGAASQRCAGGAAAYEAARRPRTSRIQLHARERGKINNATSAFQRFKRDLGYRIKKLIRPKEHTYSIEWIYGHDVTARNGAASKAA